MKVRDTLKKLPWGDRVTLYMVPRDMPSKSFEGNEEEYRCAYQGDTGDIIKNEYIYAGAISTSLPLLAESLISLLVRNFLNA